MFKKYKDRLYFKLVHTYPEVQAHYEGYKDSNPEYHRSHRLKSFKFLRQLNKYYKKGKKGDFPKPPRDYTVKGSGVFVYADRQEPMQFTPAEEVNVPANIPARPASPAPSPKPAPAAKPPAPKPPAPAAKAAAPATPSPKPQASAAPTAVMPYMDGPESEKGKRPDVYRFALSIIKFDVISFDIFDTLILRKLNQPVDVFMLVGEKLGVFNFDSVRKKSEEEVRKRRNALQKNNEVTLEEIYERVAYYTGIDPEKGAKTEFETELDMCFANPYMYRVFQILKAAGKRIYVTSNMYLQKEKMKILLQHCGYEGFEDILVSCDYHVGKGNGDLFRILLSKIGDASVIHVGDNKGADVEGAKKVGIPSKYYQACRDLGDPHRSRGISWLIDSAYRGIVNSTLHNGIQTFSRLWEYGFVYGGLAAMGYVNWIHNKAKEAGIDKILFLSRDGFLLKTIYDKMFNDIPGEYVFWSRITAFRNVEPGERYHFLQRVILEQSEKNNTIGAMLDWVGLSEMKKVFERNGLLSSGLISDSNTSIVCDLLVKYWDKVERILINSKDRTKDYLYNVVKDCSSIAIVDVGWSAKSLCPLKDKILRIMRESDNTAKVKMYMMGSLTTRENAPQMLSSDIECYMFGPGLNREIRDRMRNDSPLTLEMVEKMFTAPQNSFLGFSDKNEMEFAPPEIDNYRGYKEIEKGIMDFCEQYYHAFSKYSYLMNVNGYDTFIPIRLLLNNRKATFSIIGNLSYNTGVDPTKRENLSNVFGGKK